MSGIRTTRIGGALGAAGLIRTVLTAASASGAGSAPPTIGGGGVVQLHLGSDGEYVKFQPPSSSGQPPTQQVITSKKCVATLPSLLKITPQPAPPAGAVGLFDHGIGVTVVGRGQRHSVGRVDGPSQALTLSLGGPLAGNLISFAELDIEGKFNVTVLAQAFQARPRSGRSEEDGYKTGLGSRTRRRGQLPLAHRTQHVRHAGPHVDPSTPNGAFSLEGGADGRPRPAGTSLTTNDSLFQLADFTGVLDCGQTAPTVGGREPPRRRSLGARTPRVRRSRTCSARRTTNGAVGVAPEGAGRPVDGQLQDDHRVGSGAGIEPPEGHEDRLRRWPAAGRLVRRTVARLSR